MLNLKIGTKDHFKLAATLYRSNTSDSNPPLVIINSATGVNQRYYTRYASYLAENNFNVLTYDYRGIAASRPNKLRGFLAGITDWGQLDLPAVINYASAEFDPDKIFIIGHSIGGSILGLCPESAKAKGIINVAAQMAFYKDRTKSDRYKIYFLWHIVLPIVTKFYGYFPGKRWKLEDIPKGVVQQWHARRLMPSMEEQLTKAGYPVYFKSIRCNLLNYCLEDDPIGTPTAVGRLAALFSNAIVETKVVSPESLGVKEIGHFGFFRKEYQESLWKNSINWLKAL